MKVDEIPLPQKIAEGGGEEVLRVVRKPDGGNYIVVRTAAFTPPEWGLVLHDVAKRLAKTAVRAGVERSDGVLVTEELVLADICELFAAEHARPSDETADFVDFEKN